MSRLARLLHELAQREQDGTTAFERLRFRVEGATAIVGFEDGEAIGSLGTARFARVSIAGDTYRRVPGRDGRIRLLRIASAAARDEVIVHAAIGGAGTHPGRALVDAPRRAMRNLGLAAAEPGDRFGDEGFVHAFFDEEPLLREIDAAGLTVRERRGFTFVLERRRGAPSFDAEPFAVEVARAMRIARQAERARTEDSPQAAVAAMRERGRGAPARDEIGRARLRRAIGWVDAMMPRGENCYRRTLMELALDAGAAGETLVFGLDVGKTGHVAFKDREDIAFDVLFEIPA